MAQILTTIIMVLALCISTVSQAPTYTWSNVSAEAQFPKGYNYPVFAIGQRMIALNNGAWISIDGQRWSKTELPEGGLSSG